MTKLPTRPAPLNRKPRRMWTNKNLFKRGRCLACFNKRNHPVKPALPVLVTDLSPESVEAMAVKLTDLVLSKICEEGHDDQEYQQAKEWAIEWLASLGIKAKGRK